MLALATCLRHAAGQTADPEYLGLMIRAALELETRASFLASARPDESESVGGQARCTIPSTKASRMPGACLAVS